MNRTSALLKIMLGSVAGNSADGKRLACEERKLIAPYALPRGAAILHCAFPADSVYFVLEGAVRVVVDTQDGREAVIDVFDAPHIVGALEVLRGKEAYGASVFAATECTVARVPAQEFLDGLAQNADASFIMLRYLAWLASYSMDKSELKALAPPKDILGRFLYLAGVGRTLPCTVRYTRRAISDELHINLRTLYRYLAQMEEDGFIELRHGKIVLTSQGLAKLEQFRDILSE